MNDNTVTPEEIAEAMQDAVQHIIRMNGGSVYPASAEFVSKLNSCINRLPKSWPTECAATQGELTALAPYEPSERDMAFQFALELLRNHELAHNVMSNHTSGSESFASWATTMASRICKGLPEGTAEAPHVDD